MRKIVITIIGCALLAAHAYADKPSKNIEKAKALSGVVSKIDDARKLLDEAKADSIASANPYLWYIAGKVEYDAYNAGKKQLMVNPKSNVDKTKLGYQLYGALSNWQMAMHLDSLPNAKGKIKPKYSKEIQKRLNDIKNDYFSMGNYFYGEKKYYPDSYLMYSGYVKLPSLGITVTDSLLPKAALNASLAAYNARQYAQAIESFNDTRAFGDIRPQTYFYEIAAWRALAQEDSVSEEKARSNIARLSLEGHRNFGCNEPFFLRNYVNMELLDNHGAEAMKIVKETLDENPDNSEVLGMAARIYTMMGDKKNATDYYRKAAEAPDASADVLKHAARIIFMEGNDIWKSLEGTDDETQKMREDVIENYFKKAQQYASKAKDSLPGDIEIDTLLENINYVLLTGF